MGKYPRNRYIGHTKPALNMIHSLKCKKNVICATGLVNIFHNNGNNSTGE